MVMSLPWGKCSRCGEPLSNKMQRGPCSGCAEKQREQDMLDHFATPQKLHEHPDLAELDDELEKWYPR